MKNLEINQQNQFQKHKNQGDDQRKNKRVQILFNQQKGINQ